MAVPTTIGSASPVYVEAGRLTDGYPTMHVHSAGGKVSKGPETRCGRKTAHMRLGVYKSERLRAQGCHVCFKPLTLV